MVTSPTFVRYALASGLLLFANSLSAGAEPEPGTTSWKELTYETSSWKGSSNTRIALRPSSPQDLRTATPGPLKDVPLQKKPAQILVMDIQARGNVFGKEHQSSIQLWFDAATGAVFLRDKIRPGNEPYRKGIPLRQQRCLAGKAGTPIERRS